MTAARSTDGLRRESIGKSGHRLAQLAILMALSIIPILIPTNAVAHDAFGDLGPFYASMLHPLADPLQAAVLVGTAAFLAGRSLVVVRRAIPIFILVAGIASIAVFSGHVGAAQPTLVGLAAMAIGLAATLPATWTPRVLVYALVVTTAALVGLAPGPPVDGLTLQPLTGSILGISVLVSLLWVTFEAAARRLTPLVPKVVGAWVAAVGILVVAFFASGAVIL